MSVIWILLLTCLPLPYNCGLTLAFPNPETMSACAVGFFSVQ